MMGVLLPLLLLFLTAPSPTPTPMSTAAIESECRTYYKTAVCSEELGAWLPTYGSSFDASNANRARRGVPFETFVFVQNGKVHKEPDNGTFFVYGSAGPPKGDIYYDPTNRVAFYSQGCCAWREVVLAAASSPPPVTVRHVNLSGVRTKRGAMLGMTPNEIMQQYGHTTLFDVAGHPGVQMLSYTTRRVKAENCGNDENFAFRRGRLISIQLGWAC
jgi:hypothetical protein